MNRHPLDLTSLVWGLIFLGAATIPRLDDIGDNTGTFLWSGLLVSIGLAGIVVLVARLTRPARTSALAPDTAVLSSTPGGEPWPDSPSGAPQGQPVHDIDAAYRGATDRDADEIDPSIDDELGWAERLISESPPPEPGDTQDD